MITQRIGLPDQFVEEAEELSLVVKSVKRGDGTYDVTYRKNNELRSDRMNIHPGDEIQFTFTVRFR